MSPSEGLILLIFKAPSFSTLIFLLSQPDSLSSAPLFEVV